jgi:hypothetical protein
MNRTPPNTIPQTTNDDLRHYMELIALVATRPIVLSANVFAVWGLTANIGLTNSFSWSAGPLSNWMIWLGLALPLNLLALNLQRRKPIR